jgi:hypothetical protein
MPETFDPNGQWLDESVLTSLLPGEVITKALVRDVQLPDGAGTMALITPDNGHDHTRRAPRNRCASGPWRRWPRRSD